jgi:hypothetical protein
MANLNSDTIKMNYIPVPTPISGGLLLTYKCSATCRHCMYACSPSWKSDWITPDEIRNCLEILSNKILPSPEGRQNISLNYGLHFTGGEPFLNYNLLLSAIEIATQMQIPSTFVETNCSWCHSDADTREKLKLLKEKGLRGILISVNPYYAEYIPFEYTERCIRISADIFKQNIIIYQMQFYYLFKKMGLTGTLTSEEVLKIVKHGYNVELFLSGRATQTLRKYYPAYPASFYFNQPCRPQFLRDWHNHFDNYGNFMPGYCGGISLGDWHKLDELLTRGINPQKTPILQFFISDDFAGLYNFAKELGFEDSSHEYISKCDFCLQMRKYLISVKKFSELRPHQFYEQLYLSEND